MSIQRTLASVVLAILALVPTNTLSAQTLEESLAWLNANRPAQVENRHFQFTTQGIGATYGMQGEITVWIRWSGITSIQRHPVYPHTIVVSGERDDRGRVMTGGEDIVIRAGADAVVVDRWIRALTHVAQLRGAILVKADLFDPPAS